jgi:hypothetical protein
MSTSNQHPKSERPAERRHVRVYDRHGGPTQPTGPAEVDVPEGATDEEIIAAIRREYVNPSRPADIEWRGGNINRGWAVRYRD